KRAAAKPADRAFITRNAERQAAHDVGQTNPAGIVEVQGGRNLRYMLAQICHPITNQRRRCHTSGIPQRYIAHTEIGIKSGNTPDIAYIDIAFERTAEAGGNRTPYFNIAV